MTTGFWHVPHAHAHAQGLLVKLNHGWARGAALTIATTTASFGGQNKRANMGDKKRPEKCGSRQQKKTQQSNYALTNLEQKLSTSPNAVAEPLTSSLSWTNITDRVGDCGGRGRAGHLAEAE